MKRRLRWIAIGGLTFWLPVIATGERWGLLWLNLAPLIALSIVGVVSFFRGLKPRWGWMLAGIYILGPAVMLIPSLFVHRAPSVPGETLFIIIAFCLFPPTTLWLATLNLTIFSVLIATIALFLLTMAQS